MEFGYVFLDGRGVLLEGPPHENVPCHQLPIRSDQRHELDERLADETHADPLAFPTRKVPSVADKHANHPVDSLYTNARESDWGRDHL